MVELEELMHCNDPLPRQHHLSVDPKPPARGAPASLSSASSVPVCPGGTHAPVCVDLSNTTKMLRWATLLLLAILWQSSSSYSRPW